MLSFPRFLFAAILVGLSGCSTADSPPVRSTEVSFTPDCYGTANAALDATSCGGTKLDALLFVSPTSLTLCTAGAGCAATTAAVSALVQYGTLVATSNGSAATVSLTKSYPSRGIANFLVTAAARGSANIDLRDAAFGPEQDVGVSVIAAPSNDGRLSVASGLPTEPCNTEPLSIVFAAPTSMLAATVSDPSVATAVASGDTITVTPERIASTYLTVTAGPDSLIVPLNFQGCATPG